MKGFKKGLREGLVVEKGSPLEISIANEVVVFGRFCKRHMLCREGLVWLLE
jgi:hypothetical protein